MNKLEDSPMALVDPEEIKAEVEESKAP